MPALLVGFRRECAGFALVFSCRRRLPGGRDSGAKLHQDGNRFGAAAVCGYVQRGDAVPAGVDRHLAGLHERGDGGSFVRGGGAVQPLDAHRVELVSVQPRELVCRRSRVRLCVFKLLRVKNTDGRNLVVVLVEYDIDIAWE